MKICNNGAALLLIVLFVNTIGRVSSRRATFAPRSQLKSIDIGIEQKSIDSLPVRNFLLSHAASKRGGANVAQVQEVGGAFAFVLLDVFFRKVFKAKNISFPSQLGGCCILFGVLLLSESISPGKGDMVFELLSPGAGLLAKWLPVFFVPGLAIMPLAPSMGSNLEVVKVLSVVVVGLLFSLYTSAYAVLAIRKYQGLIPEPSTESAKETVAAPVAAAVKPYSQDLVNFLLQGTGFFGGLSISASRYGSKLVTPLRTIFMTFTTFAGYVWGARLPSSFTQVVHPLIISTIITLLASQLTGFATKASFKEVLSTYQAGTLAPMAAGAGDILMFFLGPTVVSFAIAVYSRKKVIADNFLVVLTGVLVASVGGLFGTAAYVRLLKLGGEAGRVLRLSMLPRNVTTPLAIAITNLLGGNISYAVGVVVLTGVFGATFGARLLNAVGIEDPVSRGIGVGGSAQGLGVASMASEKEAFPFAAISMILTAVTATVLASVPAVKEALLTVVAGN